jgi:DNA-binding beta-propeller fold protein YncE
MFFSIETFAGTGEQGIDDGPAAKASFSLPRWIAVTPRGVVYVTEAFSNGIRKIENGIVSTLVSREEGSVDGPIATARFRGPSGIVTDQAGNLYVADQSNHRIRKIDTSGNVTTIAGPQGVERVQGWIDDLGDSALFSRPRGITIDAMDSNLYVSEHNRIRCIPLRFLHGRPSKFVRTVAAIGIAGFADGPATVAQFDDPLDLAVTQTGDLLVADTGNLRIRHVPPSGTVTTVAGDGGRVSPTDKSPLADRMPAMHARFEHPSGLAIDQFGTVWVGDGAHLRMYSPLTGTVSTACSDAIDHKQPIEFERATGIALSEGRVFVVDANKIMVLTPHNDIEA